jgi:hypothetical protein
MRKLSRYLEPSIVVALFFLGSCSSIGMDDLQFVERGMSTNDVFLMMERNAYKVFTVVDPEDGLEYQVRMFYMVTGTQTYDCGSWIGGVWIPQECTYSVHEEFAFLFFEDSLLFWGFLHEFARSDDQRIRRVAPTIIEGSQKEDQKGYLE